MICLSDTTKHIYITWNWDSNIGTNILTGPDIYLLLAGSFFVIASLSDFLDGYISRRYNLVSNFGKLWDPIVDKCLINTVMICFAVKEFIPSWILIINILRDNFVEGFRQYSINKGNDISANKLGKLKTMTQMIAFLVIFFAFNLPYYQVKNSSKELFFWMLQNGLTIASLILSLASGYLYFVQFYLKNIKK